MTMSANERAALLSSWIKPSSDNEQDQQNRAERMVTAAVKGHAPLSSARLKVYAKGSYANNTNVRRDSDVDIVVECHDVLYYDYLPGVQPATTGGSSYTGIWTPAKLRAEVTTALYEAFGTAPVNPGKVAIEIDAVPGSRPSIDVVPSFDYERYDDPYKQTTHEGSCVFATTGDQIINWPDQQLKNGRTKNVFSSSRYKYFVRALKNAENVLAKNGTISAKPSFLMECLVWNVNNTTLKVGTLASGFRSTLVELWEGLADDGGWNDWAEPNELKYLFRGGQKWDRADAQEIVLATWRYLDY